MTKTTPTLHLDAREEEEQEEQEPSEELHIGEQVGRYVVLARLGAGGMGVVYAAHDPELDRKVALKILRRSGLASVELQQRMLREAQAMAKLAHPNVVAIHDVGEHRGAVFLAMELVAGETLGRWLARAQGRTDVLEVLTSVGRGLAAAHAQGLVHRDVKPDNIMVGGDLRVWVMDFGLARASQAREWAESSSTLEVGEAVHTDVDLTSPGTLLGTPAYMAPEQFCREPTDARTDIFALCVVAWEALYGERPYGGDTRALIARDVLQGNLRPPPRGAGVPRWLRALLMRGLATSPGDRWPTMDELLAALSRGRTRARVQVGVALIVAMMLIAAALFLWSSARHGRALAACDDASSTIDALWSEDAREGLRRGLVATGATYAATTAEKVIPWIDRRVVEWREVRGEICIAAEVERSLDPALYQRAKYCLEGQAIEIEWLIREFTEADLLVVNSAVAAAAVPADAGRCRDVARLARMPRAAEEDAVENRERLGGYAHASTLYRAGKYAEGLSRVDAWMAELGDPAPPLSAARGHLLRGQALAKLGRYDEAETELERAYFMAARRRLWEIEADAAIELIALVGYTLTRQREGERWAQHAEVALNSGGEEQGLRRALALNNLAMTGQVAGDYAEVEQLYEQSLEIRIRELGEGHPDVASCLNNLAVLKQATGDRGGAKLLHQRVRETLENALGPRHPRVATSLDNLAHVHTALGESAEARALYRQALAIREEALGPAHPEVGQSHLGLGLALRASGAVEEAATELRRALTIFERSLGPDHPDVAYALYNLARIESEVGNVDEVEALYRRSLTIFEGSLGPAHVYLTLPLAGLSRVALAGGRPEEAVDWGERAVAIAKEGHAEAEDLGAATFVLARALLAVGADRSRALALAAEARVALEEAGPGAKGELGEVEAWLAARAQGEPLGR